MKKMSTFASENGDVYEITDEFARKNRTSKILLEYDGTNITLNGTVKTHAELYEYCMTKPDFVVLVYNDLAYHVNKVTSEQIVFISSYVANGYVKMERISISNENLVTLTSGTSEMLANKTNVINGTNDTNIDKYPSLKAVADYVKPLKAGYDTLTDRVDEIERRPSGGDVPEHLPNPYKLTLTGAVSASYDGSKAVTVEIPIGGDGGGITRTRYAYNNMLNPAYETGWVVVTGNAYNSGVTTSKQSYIYVRTLPFPLAGGSTVKMTGRRKWDVATHSLVNGYPNPGTTSRMHCFDADGNFLGSVTNKTVDGTAYVYEALPDTVTATFTYYFGNNLKDEPNWIDAISAVFGEWYLGIDYEIYEMQSKIPRYDKYEEVAPRYVNRILGDIDSLRGRTIAVIGDSIDTYPDRNAVEITVTAEDVGVELRAYPTVHDVGKTYGSVTVASGMIGTEITFTPTADDVGKEIGVPLNHATKTRKTWWQNLEQELGVNVNAVAWSGSSISSRASETEHAISHAWHEATIRKCGTRIPGSMRRIAPDYIFIDRGINDYEYNFNGKVYGLNYETGFTSIPETDIVDGVRAYDVALLMTINKLRSAYPLATIIVCTVKEATRGTAVGDITYTKGGKTIAQIAEMQKRVATLTQCQVCDFHSAIPLKMVNHMSADGTHLSNTGHYMCYLEAVKCLMGNPKPAWFDRDRWDTSLFYYNP